MTALRSFATASHRSLTLDLVRGLACAMVLVYHLNRWVPKGLGQAAMELFFVLSGYLIAKSLVSSVERHGPRGVGRFTLRRMRRLMPGMVGFLIGALVLNLAMTELSGSQFAWASFASLAGWYNFYSVANFYDIEVIGFGGIWSLSLEEQFYISSALFVLLLRLITKRPTVWLAVMAVLLLSVGLWFRWAAQAGVYVTASSMELSYLPWLRVWAFGLGVTVAWAERVWPRAKPTQLGTRQALVALAGVFVLWWCVDTVVFYDEGAFFLQWAIVPVVGAIWIWLAPDLDCWAWPAMDRFEQSGGGRWLVAGIGAARVFGLASYSIYLWHCLVLAGFWEVELYGTWPLWTVQCFLSVLTGVLSWKFIELRFYSFGGKPKPAT